MRIFVISLMSATCRRQNARRQMDALGIDFEFFDAFPASELDTLKPFQACHESEWVLNTGREVTPGEIACFASHRAMWQRCVELDEPIVIMEDDFFLKDGFKDALPQLASNVAELGFIRLQDETRARAKFLRRSGRFTLSRYLKAPHSMMCYGLSPQAAERLIEGSGCVDAPVDVYVKRFWVHGQPLFGLSPYTVTESELSSDTAIKGRVKCSKHPLVRVRRSLHRLAEWFRRQRFNVARGEAISN